MSNKTFEDLRRNGIEFYRKEEENSNTFIMIPKQLYTCKFYREYLNSTARELYAWLRDRMSLSEFTTKKGSNKFVDENGYIYLVFTREEIMDVLNISKQTVADAFFWLGVTGLIFEKRLGRGQNNRIYIGKIRYLNDVDADRLILETQEIDSVKKINARKEKNKKSKNEKSKISTSRSIEFRLPEVENLDGNNTDTTNTDTSDTDPVVVGPLEETLIKEFEDNICELKKTPKASLKEYINKYDPDFIRCVIEYCSEINTKSFAGFKTAIEGFLSNNLTTRRLVTEYLIKYRAEKKRRRETAQKGKGEAKPDNFNNFEQRVYDYDNLEKQLLGWDK